MRGVPKCDYTFGFDVARALVKIIRKFHDTVDFRRNQKYDEIRYHK